MEPKSSRGAGDFLVKTMRKQSLRAKERVLERLGKADKTQDELFDEYVANISKLQNNSLRIQKEVRNYVTALKTMDTASKGLLDALNEICQPEWSGQLQLSSAVEQLQQARAEHLRKLNDDLQNNVTNYLNQFPEIKNKIAKRNRKLVDYDAARYNLSAQLNAPKRNDMKAAKAQDELVAMQRVYEAMNDELHRELPAVHESRIGFYGYTLKAMFDAEYVYHAEVAKVSQTLAEFANKFADQGKVPYKYGFGGKKPVISAPITSPERISSPLTEQEADLIRKENGHRGQGDLATPRPTVTVPETQQTTTVVRTVSVDSEPESESKRNLQPSTNSAFTPVATVERNASGRVVSMYPELPAKLDPIVETRIVRNRRDSTTPSESEEDSGAHTHDQKASTESTTVVRDAHPSSPKSQLSGEYATPTADGPADVTKTGGKISSYKVKATNPYTAEDHDELSFEAGDIISVIPFDNPEEQRQGWLMG
ncbi:myc box-dependent-interacting protein 1-like isoform X2 [Paramacrobiotus metropolitanus]|uniref:myc box-dependent-interacting protein 1-like isoform X2 n=1 Tax=Paramacrobiotus metropolitanus TaxID=2943436 RepID=UPI002445D2E6|nr:myc box-dependent-interacting protein 1-like isoform X2 [Paramacrobiotus metropolitanus]